MKLSAAQLSLLGQKAGALVLLSVAVLLLFSTLRLHGAGASCSDPTAQNLTQISLAVMQYEQDYDKRLPVVHTQADFQAALLPFTHNPSLVISPETGQPFVFNLALSGLSISQFSDPGTTEVAREDPPPTSQPAAVLFLDGHVERGGAEVGNPATLVVSRAKALALGVLQYTQDYDETYPPMQTPAAFQAAVRPYVSTSRDFYTPSGAAFVPNPALSGQALSSIASPSTTVLLSEPPPYVGSLDTVAYADGHVTRGGIEPVGVQGAAGGTVSRAKQLGLAVIEYVQDYDEHYPPMQTQPAFQAAVLPYLKDVSKFSTPTGALFIPNPALSGVSLASIDTPAVTVLFQDVPPYVDGSPTTCYADGHVVHQPGVGANPVMPRLPAPDLLWDNASGQIALWTLDSSGGFTQNQYGPFPGWTAQALAVGPDLVPHLLWTKPSVTAIAAIPILTQSGGQISTWAVKPDGSYTHQEYGPYPGWTAQNIAVGPDNVVHLLWTDTQGQLSLWSISADGMYTHHEYGPYPLWTARALSVDSFNHIHVLWTKSDGTISLWDLDASSVPAFQNFGPFAGWSALALASGPDGYSQILWNRTDNALSLWTTGTDGTYGHQEYGPYPGWQAQGLTVDANNQTRVLWTKTDGTVSLWGIDCSNNFSFTNYGPYPGWAPQSLSAGW